MRKALKDELKFVIENQHGGSASLLETVRLPVPNKEKSRWDGTVYIFDLKDNRTATRAYAWALPISGGTTLRYFAALHLGFVTSPLAAVKSAAVAIRNSTSGEAHPDTLIEPRAMKAGRSAY
jgi:hypothetical protein